MSELWKQEEYLTRRENYDLAMHRFLKSIKDDQSMRDHASKIVGALRDGFDNEDEAIGIHGSSIEAIMHLIQSGTLNGTSSDDAEPEFASEGDIFVFPYIDNLRKINPQFLKENTKLETLTFKEAYEDASIYASLISRRHYMSALCGGQMEGGEKMSQLVNLWSYSPFPVDRNTKMLSIMKWIHEYSEHDMNFVKFMESSNLSDEELALAMMKALRRKGVIMLISSSVANRLQLLKGDDDKDIRISGGLITVDDIIGIDTLGKQEAEFLRNVESAVKDNK